MPTTRFQGEDVEERGIPLAAIPRGKPDRSGQHWEEFRVVLDEFKGHSYLSLRLWQRNQYGNFLPVAGKGCSVRLSEAEQVAAALLEGLRIADSPGAGRPAHEPSRDTPARPAPTRPSKPVNPADRPLLSYAPASASFDECDGDDR